MKKMLSGVLAAAMLTAPLSGLADTISLDSRLTVNPELLSMLAGEEATAAITKLLDAVSVDLYGDGDRASIVFKLNGEPVYTTVSVRDGETMYMMNDIIGSYCYTQQDLLAMELDLYLNQIANELGVPVEMLKEQIAEIGTMLTYLEENQDEIMASVMAVVQEIAGGFDQMAILKVMMLASGLIAPSEPIPYQEEDLPGVTQMITVTVTPEQLAELAQAAVDVIDSNTVLAGYVDAVLPQVLGEGVTMNMLCTMAKSVLTAEIMPQVDVGIYANDMGDPEYITVSVTLNEDELYIAFYPENDDQGNIIGYGLDIWPDEDNVITIGVVSYTEDDMEWNELDVIINDSMMLALMAVEQADGSYLSAMLADGEEVYSGTIGIAKDSSAILFSLDMAEGEEYTSYMLSASKTADGLVVALYEGEEEIGALTLVGTDNGAVMVLTAGEVELARLTMVEDDNSADAVLDPAACVSLSGVSFEQFVQMIEENAETAVPAMAEKLMPYLQ